MAAFRGTRRPICHVVRLYAAGGSDVDLLRREEVEAGAEIRRAGVGRLADAVCEPALEPELLLRGEMQNILFDASERDLRAVIAVDAVSQKTEERLADLERIGVRSMTVTEIGNALTTACEPLG